MSVILNKETTVVASSSVSTPVREAADVAHIQSALEAIQGSKAIKESAVLSPELVAAQEPKIDDVDFLSSKEATPEKCLALLNDAVQKKVDFNKKQFFDQMRKNDDSFLPVVDCFFKKKCVSDVNCLKDEEYETLLDDLCADMDLKNWLLRYLIEQGICICPPLMLAQACKNNDIERVSIILKKSLGYAEKYVKDYQLKHDICSYNGIRSSNNIEGEDERGEDAKVFAQTLNNLPKQIREMIPEECLKMTGKAFEIANQQRIKDIKEGNLVLIPAGSKEHEIYLVFALGYMFICNRGDRPDAEKMVQGYKINKDAFSVKHYKQILKLATREGTKEETEDYLYKELPEALSASIDEFCAEVEEALSPKKEQKIDNCTFASAKLALRLSIAIGLSSCKKDVKKLELAKKFSKAVSAHMRLQALDKYLEFHQENKDLGLYDEDFAKEAISLAQKHLKSNPIIDLKDYLHCKKAFEAGMAAAS